MCVVSLFADGFLLFSAETGGADTRHSQVVCVTTALVLLPFDNEISDDSHTLNFGQDETHKKNGRFVALLPQNLEMCKTTRRTADVLARIVVLLGRSNTTTTTMLFCAGLISK